MNAADYKAEIDRANAVRRSMLSEVLQIVLAQDPALSDRVLAELRVEAVQPPDKHTGQSDSAWVTISLPEVLANDVLECLAFAEAGSVGADGETTLEASHAAGLVDGWGRWLARRA